MSRWIFLIILVLLVITLSACELDAEQRLPALVARPTETHTITPTFTRTPTPTSTVIPTHTPIPTNTPIPTATPIPGDRLDLALRAYDSGDYETARREFAALLTDAGSDSNERRRALHWRGRSELALGDSAAAIATLKMFLEHYPSDDLTRAAQFNLGVAYEKSAQLQEAITAYRGSIIPGDPINVYIYERIGDLQFQTNAYTDTITSYRAGIDVAEDIGFQVHLREGVAQAELALDNPAGALDQYETILKASKNGSYRAKILRLAGEAHLAADEPEAAYKRYLEAVNNYPEAYDSYLTLVELVNAEVPVDQFQRGLVDYYAGVYQPAIAAFDRYLDPSESPPLPITSTDTITTTTPTISEDALESIITQTTILTDSDAVTDTASLAASSATPDEIQTDPTRLLPKAADAIWLTAISWQALGGYNNAIRNFQRLIDEHPTSPNWGQAHLEIGKTLINQDNISRAKVAFRDFAASHSGHPLAGEALWRAALLELNGDLLEEAYSSLVNLADTHPDDDYADEALYWAGQAAFMQENYREAAETWARLVDTYPTSELVSFGRYWQAKALLALGRDKEAEIVLTAFDPDPLDYYSLRARDLLTGNQPHTVPLVLPGKSELVREQTQAERWLTQWSNLDTIDDLTILSPRVSNDSAFRRGEALLKIGLRDEALAEFEKVKETWWDDPQALYQLAVYFRKYALGRLNITTASRLIFLSPADRLDQVPLFIQRLLYPIYYQDVIFTEAEKYKLDPALILAIMRQESLFERSAESVAGARGLMQVMPATGEYVAERANHGSYDPDQLWLPYFSIKYGTWYINQQLGIFDGNQFAALAAYNAGPGNVLEWIKVSDDLDIFVESIPFWESRTYVRNIYVNLAAYRRIYDAQTKVIINSSQ